MFDTKIVYAFKAWFSQSNTAIGNRIDWTVLISKYWRIEECFPYLKINDWKSKQNIKMSQCNIFEFIWYQMFLNN